MDCRSARHAWHDREDGVLDDTRAARLEAHLGGCAACREFVAQMGAIETGLGALRREADVAALARFPEAAQRLAPRAAPRVLRLPSYYRAAGFAVAAAVLLAVGASIYFARPTRSDRSVIVNAGGRTQNDSRAAPVAAAAQVKLVGASANNYLVVSEKTSDARVHIFSLHAVVGHLIDGAAATTALAAAGSEPAVAGL